MTVWSGTPRISRTVAAVWRASCSRASRAQAVQGERGGGPQKP